MPKLRKTTVQSSDQQSQNLQKYTTFEDRETQYPEPLEQNQKVQKIESPLGKKKQKSSRKQNQSKKKLDIADEKLIHNKNKQIKPRKSRSKKKVRQITPQRQKILHDQNQNNSNSILVKQQPPNPSHQKLKLQPTKRRLRKDKPKQIESNQQLRQFDESQNDSNQIKKQQKNDNQQQDSSIINFNRRLKTKKKNDQQIMELITSKYREDQTSTPFGNNDNDSSGEFGRPMQSDLTQLQLLVKKKQKKGKKQKQVKIKNKYFTDIQFQPNQKPQQEDVCQYEGQQPPQNFEELIFEKKQPRKTKNLNEMIQKRVNHVKDRRQLNGGQNELNYKNEIKKKINLVKDAEQLQIDVALPNHFTKKSASNALYLKNAIQKQQKYIKKGINSQSSDVKVSSKLQKTSSMVSISQSSKETEFNKKNTMLSQELQQKIKRKGVRRENFYTNLNKQIMSKRYTDINSQQVKDCFKTSTLDEADLDIDFYQQANSNSSSRSGSKDSKQQFQRRPSISSQDSKTSQTNSKSNSRISQGKNILVSNNGAKIQSKWNIDFNQRSQQNSNSARFKTNPLSRSTNTIFNQPISQVKQSEASSIQNSSQINSILFKNKITQISLDNPLVKNQIENAYPQTFKIFQSENQELKNDLKEDSNINKITQNDNIQDAKQEQSKKLGQKLKRLVNKGRQSKLKKDKKQTFEDLLNDGDEQSQSKAKRKRQKRKQKKSQKKKKNDKNKNKDDAHMYQKYFQIQADYSSSQEGHTDSQADDLNEDIDIDGNIDGLVDYGQMSQQNEHFVRRKYLQDQQKKDQQIIDRIMKGMYGRKKYQQTDSQKRLKQRMIDAAKKNKTDDNNNEDIQMDKPYIHSLTQVNSQIEQKEQQINSHEKRKLKEFQDQFNHGAMRNAEFDQQSLETVYKGDTWRMITAVLPARKSTHIPVPRSGIKKNVMKRQKSGQNKKSIMDLKSNNVQQQIYTKRMSVDWQRPQSTGNRNKLQKTTQIQLDIRDKNINQNQDIQI